MKELARRFDGADTHSEQVVLWSGSRSIASASSGSVIAWAEANIPDLMFGNQGHGTRG